MEAVDLSCRENSAVYAPFDGELSPWRPFEGTSGQESQQKKQDGCRSDQGARIDGQGQWQGYHVLLGSVHLFRYSGKVRAGQKIGVALDLECAGMGKTRQRPKKDENFLRVQLFRESRPIDPTHHLIDCMCTGQICETNRVNAFDGPPFKYDSRFNGVRGWELKCPDVQPTEQGSSESFELADAEMGEEQEPRTAPEIYSPIEGEVIGRIRVTSEPNAQSYTGCANEGIFVVGTGKWADYEVRIYNARFRESLGLGRQHIEQGQHIGHRLDCPGEEIPPTVFMEIRFQGTLLDISDAIMAKSCKHKLRNILDRFRI